MFKTIKQSKKLKVFKNSWKSIHKDNAECIDGKCKIPDNYYAKYTAKKQPKKRLPKDNIVFVSSTKKK